VPAVQIGDVVNWAGAAVRESSGEQVDVEGSFVYVEQTSSGGTSYALLQDTRLQADFAGADPALHTYRAALDASGNLPAPAPASTPTV